MLNARGASGDTAGSSLYYVWEERREQMNLRMWLQSRRRRAALARTRREFAAAGFNLGAWTDAEVEAGLRRAGTVPGVSCLTAEEADALLGVLMKGDGE